jgi:hypothetical protein
VYIKAAFGGGDITIKGIGVVKDDVIVTASEHAGLVEIGRNVHWLDTQRHSLTRPSEKNNVRNNTIYEEFHPAIQAEILKLVLAHIGSA